MSEQSNDEQFNVTYEELGLVESDIDPVILRKIFDRGYLFGYGFGYAAGHAVGKKDAPKVEPVPVPGNGRSPRVWRNKGTVRPDDPRPASEKQIAFIAKLFKKAKINTNVCGTELVLELSKMTPPIACIAGEPMPAAYTTGQASQLINLLLRWPV